MVDGIKNTPPQVIKNDRDKVVHMHRKDKAIHYIMQSWYQVKRVKEISKVIQKKRES